LLVLTHQLLTFCF